MEFYYGENYNLVVSPSWVSRLQHLFTCNHAIFAHVGYSNVRCILDDHTEEDKFPAEYSIEYTWPCITSDYEKNSVSLGFSRFRWCNAAEIFFAEANITANKCDSLFLPARSIARIHRMFRRAYVTFRFFAHFEKNGTSASFFVHPLYIASSRISIHRGNLSRVYSRERDRLESFPRRGLQRCFLFAFVNPLE